MGKKTRGATVCKDKMKEIFDRHVTLQACTPNHLFASKPKDRWPAIDKHRLMLSELLDTTGGRVALQISLECCLRSWLEGFGKHWSYGDIETSAYRLRNLMQKLLRTRRSPSGRAPLRHGRLQVLVDKMHCSGSSGCSGSSNAGDASLVSARARKTSPRSSSATTIKLELSSSDGEAITTPPKVESSSKAWPTTNVKGEVMDEIDELHDIMFPAGVASMQLVAPAPPLLALPVPCSMNRDLHRDPEPVATSHAPLALISEAELDDLAREAESHLVPIVPNDYKTVFKKPAAATLKRPAAASFESPPPVLRRPAANPLPSSDSDSTIDTMVMPYVLQHDERAKVRKRVHSRLFHFCEEWPRKKQRVAFVKKGMARWIELRA